MQPDPYAEKLNEFLRSKLESASCLGGRLECRLTAARLLTLSGKREDGRPILFWDLDRRPLPRLIDDYLAANAPDAAALIIDIDLLQDSFRYQHVSSKEAVRVETEEKKQQEMETLRGLEEMKARISEQTTPYGRQLAEKVAAGLQHGSLGYSHRDYCGMGLERDPDGKYLYGELWDGGMITPEQTFASAEAFVSWLAAQSDASMARLGSKETFYWNNQVINRERLEAFVRDSAI